MRCHKMDLVGKVIRNVRISEDKDIIIFETDDGEFVGECEGDCCSSTWIEHIELPAYGFPAKVLDVNDLDMPDLGDMQGHDVVSYYGLEIKTDKGSIKIDYRNSSNGYYGGSIEFTKSLQNFETCKDLLDDF